MTRALFHPVPIVLSLATVGAAFISPLLAIPGAVAWAIAVYFLSRRGGARQPGTPDLSGLMDMTSLPPTIQRDVFEVRQALADIRTTAQSTSRDQQIMLADVLREAGDVEQALVKQAIAAGQLHGYLASTLDQAESPDRRRMMEMLQGYRGTMAELVASAQKLRSSVQLMAAGQLVDYESEEAPARQMDEMKASVAALEEVMSTSTMLH